MASWVHFIWEVREYIQNSTWKNMNEKLAKVLLTLDVDLKAVMQGILPQNL